MYSVFCCTKKNGEAQLKLERMQQKAEQARSVSLFFCMAEPRDVL